MSVLCAYAPTVKATPGVKQKFYADLQDTIDKVPANDNLILLGDFNARVGVLDHNDLWSSVLGRYGLSERNIAGEELLGVLCLECSFNHEHLVSEEGDTSRYLVASCH